MDLDKRIKALSDILNCFDIEKAKQFIGQKGYFANDLNYFSNIHSCYYDILAEVKDNDRPFKDEDCCPWCFFIPESFLKPKEKKFRPFANTKEFFLMRNFGWGALIHLRSKADHKEYHLMITGWTDEVLMLGDLRGLSFNELLQKFELWDCEDNKFKPFGVEKEK